MTGKRAKVSVVEQQARLRGVGLRSTAPRIAVLEHFQMHGGQQSHAEVFDALGARGFDRATLYRILMDLTEAKILTRTDLGDHVWRFELRTDAARADHAEEHPHFVCVDCGQVSCLAGLTVKVTGGKVPKAIAKNQFALQMTGRCDKCA